MISTAKLAHMYGYKLIHKARHLRNNKERFTPEQLLEQVEDMEKYTKFVREYLTDILL
jgi:hypothetical protein